MKEFDKNPAKVVNKSDLPVKRVTKTCNQAKRYGSKQQNRINEAVEGSYHSLIEKVKTLYSTLPNISDRIVVELDRKSDPLQPMAIYSFLTPHFYFYIECSVLYQYRVEYLMHQCPYENEILEWLQTTILRSYNTEVVKIPDYPAFFEEVLRVQPKKFIHLL